MRPASRLFQPAPTVRMRSPLAALVALLLAAPLHAQEPVKPDTAPPSPSTVCADRDGNGRCDDANRPRDCSRETPDCGPSGVGPGACIDRDRDGRCDVVGRRSRVAAFFAELGGFVVGLFVDNNDDTPDRHHPRSPGT